jgi:hypothetical protein
LPSEVDKQDVNIVLWILMSGDKDEKKKNVYSEEELAILGL